MTGHAGVFAIAGQWAMRSAATIVRSAISAKTALGIASPSQNTTMPASDTTAATIVSARHQAASVR